MQEDIINAVLEGKDCLALMPTGGGKSVCYQVPAMMKEGLCLVITPLIALMQDQVQALNEKGIKAIAVHSGMNSRQVEIALDNAILGGYKFLYVSPERLETESFLLRAENMPVNLIAIDEAHCISEWGYDFRPSYLKIADIREYFEGTPVLALTASATPEVQNDIKERLSFGANALIFRQSFDRQNLIYGVVITDNKKEKLISLFKKVAGTGIVYVRSRRGTIEVASFLNQNGIRADAYHAGLPYDEKMKRQNAWKKGDITVMVCTNAFGMGIDKADVRVVAHYDIPDSLEAYYQEAGRGGRDGKKSYAVTYATQNDLDDLETKRMEQVPTADEIRNIYHMLGSYLQLPYESGRGESFDFEIPAFAKHYNLPPLKVYAAMRVLEEYDYISLNEGINQESKIIILTDHETLYRFEVDNEKYEPLIKVLLRTYGGIMDIPVSIREEQISKHLMQPLPEVIRLLLHLHKLEILDYQPRKTKPQVVFITERLPKENILADTSVLHKRLKVKREKLLSSLHYASSVNECRSAIILSYFGEEPPLRCGHCDVCIRANSKEKDEEIVMAELRTKLSIRPMAINDLLQSTSSRNDLLIHAVRKLKDMGLVTEKNGLLICSKT